MNKELKDCPDCLHHGRVETQMTPVGAVMRERFWVICRHCLRQTGSKDTITEAEEQWGYKGSMNFGTVTHRSFIDLCGYLNDQLNYHDITPQEHEQRIVELWTAYRKEYGDGGKQKETQ